MDIIYNEGIWNTHQILIRKLNKGTKKVIERIQSHKVQGGIYYGSTTQYFSDERKQNVRYHTGFLS